jgi:hypothetical protein
MKPFDINRALAMLLFLCVSVEMLAAAPPDPRLLSLVPPGTQVVAGVSIRTTAGQPESFLLMSRNNVIDRRDFISLSAVGDSMITMWGSLR